MATERYTRTKDTHNLDKKSRRGLRTIGDNTVPWQQNIEVQWEESGNSLVILGRRRIKTLLQLLDSFAAASKYEQH